MDNRTKHIIIAWNELDELRQTLTLTDEEIMGCIDAIRERVINAEEQLRDEFSTDEYNELFE